MEKRNYWLDLFTGTTWKEFLAAGGQISGFRESRWKSMQKMRPGDYLLCYLTGLSRWVGVLEVVSAPFRDETPIWKDESFPCRVKVKQVITLTPETAVPVLELRDKLSVFKGLKNPAAWSGAFRGSPVQWKSGDGEAILDALTEAERNPVVRPVNQAKLARRPPQFKAKIGLVTVPEAEVSAADPEVPSSDKVRERVKEPTTHTEIQWQLLKLGCDMGFRVWVARNDKGREFNGNAFADLPNLVEDLPLQFDEATNRTIELIDVLWLKGNAIVAAFEIESTTSIYSGLLRMSDLISMQPNLSIPLYLVAPDDRRDKVLTEVNRPTFLRLAPPLAEMCRFISFSSLRERLAQVGNFARFLKPEFLEELSESCELADV
jgi:hypothetical protein